MHITVDRDICIGAGLCALTAPMIFGQDEETGRVILFQEDPSSEDKAAARMAAHLCPSGAMKVEG